MSISITYVIFSKYLYFILSIIYFDYIFAINKLSNNQSTYMYIVYTQYTMINTVIAL